jgi:hypothetical protein
LVILLTKEGVEIEEEVVGEATNRLQTTLDEVLCFEGISF